MDKFSQKLNTMLVDTFRHILKLEEKMLRSLGNGNLSISDIHIIEAINKDGIPKTISALADDLGVTVPSVTNAIMKLESRGYVNKTKSDTDARSVLVSLTRLGVKVDNAHRYFHKKMVDSLAKGLTEPEKSSLSSGIEKLEKFFRGKLD